MIQVLCSSLCLLFVLLHPTWCRISNEDSMDQDVVQNETVSKLTASPNQKSTLSFNPEWKMSVVQIITYRGYPCQIHSVTTSDGYILELHRIPYGRAKSYGTVPGKPVLLAHGFAASSADFILVPSNRSLPYQLADLGYDVWLCNFRGNEYSRNHASLRIDSEEYWTFSWDEIGRFDVPAIINYILKTTGQPKLNYIANSMGNTVFFVAMVYSPELNDKIDAMFALAAVASISETKDAAFVYGDPMFRRPLVDLQLWYYRNQAYSDANTLSTRIQNVACDLNLLANRLCGSVPFFLFGFSSSDKLDTETFANLRYHFPSGSSFRALYLYYQNYFAGKTGTPTFIPYDFGRKENLKRYGQASPPPYNLTKVTAPIYIFSSPNDFLANPTDIAWLTSKLPNVKASIIVNDTTYNHLDFIWALNANEIVFKRIFSLLPPPYSAKTSCGSNES